MRDRGPGTRTAVAAAVRRGSGVRTGPGAPLPSY